MANRLAGETSPYLLQHAHNPVDWYPWGPEAFAAARRENKPIFLSVGYSTCYWCHVMERQSFENPDIAALMNEHFINIKVDREERPDVDQLYMNAVHALAGQGGWPMSVFLTPDLKPFYAGTYFPPADGHGRVGFPRLLNAIDQAWNSRRDQVDRSLEQVVDALRRMAEPAPPRAALRIDEAFLKNILDQSTSDYDPVHGGFGSAPKFPRQTLLELILASQRQFPDPEKLEQLLHTLNAMAAGGIHDHLGGAFHRYSTDDQWLVPHFEIMLYDNAMLAWVYAEAYAQTKEPALAAVARAIVDFVLREMTSPDGAFYTAIDAEVDAQEGLSYLWTTQEIEQVLGADAKLFNRVYGLDAGPNFADPHHGKGEPDKNILFLPEPIDRATDEKLAPMRAALYARRRQRKQPMLDTKALTSWNALMIRGLAHVAAVVNEPKYLAAAQKAADYLLRVHIAPDGGLHRTSKDGRAKGEAFLDDYAFFAQALLAIDRREDAARLAEQMCKRFGDDKKGGFFFTPAGSPDMLVRQKTAADSPLPSGNAVAAAVMLQLGKPHDTRGAITCFAGQMERFGAGMSSLVQATIEYVSLHGAIDVSAAVADGNEVVSATAKWERPDLLIVSISIAPGFHIYAHEVDEALTPTQVTVTGESAGLVGEIDYPPGVDAKLADQVVPIYDGRVSISVRFATAVGPDSVTVYLQYQPCDERSCLAVVNRRLVVQ